MSVRIDGRAIDRLLVVGFARTGRAVVDFALDRGLAAFVSEGGRLSDEDRDSLRARGVRFEDGGHTIDFLADVDPDAVVVSPAVPADAPLLRAAAARGIPVHSEIDLASAAVECPIIAVTGTNGKSSTVTAIGAILRDLGLRVEVAGNIGIPFVSVVDRAATCDAVVVEVSSFQLEQSDTFHPRVGVLLNLAPDHLDRHGSMAAYAAAKARLFRRMTPADTAVLPGPLAGEVATGVARVVFFDSIPIDLPAGADRLARHEVENVRAALAACAALVPGFDPSAVPLAVVTPALALPFRTEPVGAVGGVRVINDSKATNPHSTIAALDAVGPLDAPIVLLLGGHSKSHGYEALPEAIAGRDVRRVVLFGEAGPTLARLFDPAAFDVTVAADLAAAVDVGLRSAEPGDVLLFSPACSSYDEFRDYEERGRAFRRLVEAHPGFSPA